MKNYLLSWNKTIDGYPEKTGCIVDANYNLLDTIDLLFNRGEYSDETIEKKQKYKIKGDVCGDNQDHYLISGVDITVEEAILDFKEEIDSMKRISEYLTSEKTQEILNFLKK